MRPRIGGRSGRRGIRAGVPAGARGRIAGPRSAARGAAGADTAGQRHGGEQRDRRGAGHRDACRDGQAGRRAVPYRYRAGHGEDPAGPDGMEGRSGLDQRPQALRTERGRRALCSPPATRAAEPAVLGRRPGAWLALRHPARPADRRVLARPAAWPQREMAGRGQAASADCATACWTGCARRSQASW